MKKKILIVEDTVDLLENLTDCLQVSGYDVWPAHNAREGIERLMASVPDLVITDLMMGEFSGFELIKKMKSDPTLKKVPVIIFSARPLLEYQDEALHMGVNAFIQKPSTLEEIFATIEKTLNL